LQQAIHKGSPRPCQQAYHNFIKDLYQTVDYDGCVGVGSVGICGNTAAGPPTRRGPADRHFQKRRQAGSPVNAQVNGLSKQETNDLYGQLGDHPARANSVDSRLTIITQPMRPCEACKQKCVPYLHATSCLPHLTTLSGACNQNRALNLSVRDAETSTSFFIAQGHRPESHRQSCIGHGGGHPDHPVCHG